MSIHPGGRNSNSTNSIPRAATRAGAIKASRLPLRGLSLAVIRFHYHTAPRDIPRLGVRRGDTLVHAYSDTSLEELIAWGRQHGLKPEWIDRRNALPHYDLFGEGLGLAGPGVSRAQLVSDLRSWRAVQKTSARRVQDRDISEASDGAAV